MRIHMLVAVLTAYRAWQQACVTDDELHQECYPDEYKASAASVLKATTTLAKALDSAIKAYLGD